MLTIGEFSHVCRASIKTIRYYQDLGILEPAKTDAASGYRYYDASSHERMTSISVLKDLGFALKEIKTILETCSSENDLQRFIDSKLSEVEQKLKNLRELKNQLERVRRDNAANDGTDATEICEFNFYLDYYAARALQGTYDKIGTGFNWLYKSVGRFAIGKPYAFYQDLEYNEESARFSAVFELKKSASDHGIPNGVELSSFPKTKAVKLVHTGPYGSQGTTYARLFNYCREHGYTVKPPIIEHFIRGPGMIFQGNPDQYKTECILLVE